MMHSPFPEMDPYLEASSIWPMVVVCKAGERPDSNVWLISVRQPLSTTSSPLLSSDPPVPLDLGRVLCTAYNWARYDLRADYRRPPIPPLSSADAAWAVALLGAQGRAPQGDRQIMFEGTPQRAGPVLGGPGSSIQP
jgi:hypothetical protein